jgi:hypothetical protein
LILLLVFTAGYKNKEEEKSNLAKKYPVNGMQADFYQLLAQIEKNHPALYDFTSKEE